MKVATFPQDVAMRDPVNHVFIPEVGYARANKELPHGPVKGARCEAPTPPEHGSRHLLQPQKPHEPLFSTWNDAAKCWMFVGGRRLGFKPDYLASHGWTYLRAAPPSAVMAPTERRH